jgi:hypothetical protein
MYNPINMQVGDEQRLKDKDLREKNKKARYEVRYDVEDYTRKSGLAEQDRLNILKLNKISGMRFREEIERGFDILSNNQLAGKEIDYKIKLYKEGVKPLDAF